MTPKPSEKCFGLRVGSDVVRRNLSFKMLNFIDDESAVLAKKYVASKNGASRMLPINGLVSALCSLYKVKKKWVVSKCPTFSFLGVVAQLWLCLFVCVRIGQNKEF
jgi:hypothetical protein